MPLNINILLDYFYVHIDNNYIFDLLDLILRVGIYFNTNGS